MRLDHKKHETSGRPIGEQNARRPFDSREIDRLPHATEQDPPYRPWWIVDGPSPEEADPQP